MKFLASNRLIVVILILAGAVRCGYAWRAPLDERDAQIYRDIAQHLVAGKGYTLDGTTPNTHRPPLVPFILAGLKRIGAPDVAARQLWAAIGVLTIWVVYRCVTARHGLVAANLAAIGFAIYPYNVLMGGSTSTETPNLLLIFLILLMVTRWQRQATGRAAVVLGIAAGLIVLNRPEMVLLVLFVCGLLLFDSSHRWPQRLQVVTTCLGLMAFVVLPFSWRTSRIAGHPTLVTTAGSWVFWEGNNPWFKDYHEGRLTGVEFYAALKSVATNQPSDAAADASYKTAAKAFWLDQTPAALRLLAYKTRLFWQIPGISLLKTTPAAETWRVPILVVGLLTYVPLLVASSAGAIRLGIRGQLSRVAIYLTWIGLAYLSHIGGASVTRYRFASGVDAMLIVIAAVAWGAGATPRALPSRATAGANDTPICSKQVSDFRATAC